MISPIYPAGKIKNYSYYPLKISEKKSPDQSFSDDLQKAKAMLYQGKIKLINPGALNLIKIA